MSQRLKRFLFHQSTCSVASPVPEIVLPAAKAVAVEAFPVKAPTKDVEVIDTIPAIVLTVERAAIAVVPNVNNVPVNASRNFTCSYL
jgi:hypothetical protein